MDLPDFVKESVPQIQILCTFQADFSRRNSDFKVGFMDALMEPDFSPSLNDLPEKQA